MTIDLSTLTVPELRRLATSVDKAIVSAETKHLKAARVVVEKVAKEYGVSVGALVEAEKLKPKPKRKANSVPKKSAAQAKYRNPSDPKQTWTGKGRRPQWYRDAIEGGTPDADLLI